MLLPYTTGIPIIITPAALLVLLTIIPTNRLPTIVKQILAIPLIMAVFLLPFAITLENKIAIVAVCCMNFNMVLRFTEIFLVAPILLGKAPYNSFDTLSQDLWSCVRTFPTPAKQDNKKLGIKKGDVIEYVKDKNLFHLSLNVLINLVIIDVMAALVMTYTGSEAEKLMTDRSPVFFFMFVIAVIVITCAFNLIGFVIHFTYCVAYEKGSYSSAQYRLLMLHPIISSSLDDLWSKRWHALFKSTWLAFPFRPVRILSERILAKRVKNPKQVSYILGSLSVFIISSMMHEYIIACSLGLTLYKRVFMGEQFAFFMSQGVGVLIEHLISLLIVPHLPKAITKSYLARFLCHVWVGLVGFYTFPFILHGFIAYEMHLDNPVTFLNPYVIQFLRQYPSIHGLFGSRLFVM